MKIKSLIVATSILMLAGCVSAEVGGKDKIDKSVSSIEESLKDMNLSKESKIADNSKDSVNEIKKQKTNANDKENQKDEEDSVKHEATKEDPVKYETITGSYMATVNGVNVRKSHDVNSESIGRISPHEKVEAKRKITINNVTWIEFSNGSLTGWQSSHYLEPYKELTQKPMIKKIENEISSKKTENISKSDNKNVNEYKAMNIYYNGRSVGYKNIGTANTSNGDGTTGSAQKVIDTTGYVATYGGDAVFNGYSNTSTHFIGHNGKQFIGLTNANTFIVTDSNGNAFEYVKERTHLVNEYGVDVNTGASIYDSIMSSGGGNKIVLQTTEVHPKKWIVIAKFNREL